MPHRLWCKAKPVHTLLAFKQDMLFIMKSSKNLKFQIYQQMSKTPMVLCFLLLLAATTSFTIQSNMCSYPLVVEYLANEAVSTNDLGTVVQKNPTLALNSVSLRASTDTYTIDKINCDLKYPGQQSVSPSGPLKVTVYSDAITADLSWIATQKTLIGTHNFSVTANISGISFSYVKAYNTTSKKYQIQIEQDGIRFTKDMIKVTYDPKNHPKDNQVAKFKELIESKLFEEIQNELRKFLPALRASATQQGVSTTFPSDTQNYKYKNTEINIDTKVMGLSSMSDRTVVYGYNGYITGLEGQTCPTSTPDMNKNCTLFFSKEFISNFVQHSISLESFEKVVINESRSAIGFSFKLSDLEPVFNGLGEFSQYAENPIWFACEIEGSEPDYQYRTIRMNVKWTCSGYLSISSSEQTKIIDMSLLTAHTFALDVKGGKLLVKQDTVAFLQSEYRNVDSLVVQNTKLADTYSHLFIKDFVDIETIGTGFTLRPSSTIAIFENKDSNGVGIWVR